MITVLIHKESLNIAILLIMIVSSVLSVEV